MKTSSIAQWSRCRTIAVHIICAVAMVFVVLPHDVAAAAKSKKTPVPYGAPVRLVVPRMGIDVAVDQSSISKTGKLDPPPSSKRPSWYKNGALPGTKGNALILGHVDWYDGPAVLYRLSSLRVGDIVTVVNDKKQTFRFRVYDKKTYVNGAEPLELITSPSKKRRLNLITCTGSYSRVTKNYSKRLVVYTELIQ